MLRRHLLGALALSLFVAGTGPRAWSAESATSTPAELKSVDGKEAAQQQARSEEYYELYKLFADTMDQVERNYVKEIDRRELMEAAIEGIITKLDPHSSYIGPEELTGFKNSVESQFGGIGIEISIEGGQLKVLSPLVDTPAYKAGLRAGDSIVKIAGESTSGITLDEAVKRLKGEAGTSVTLTIVHPGSSEEETLTIGREIVQVETVLGDRRKADDSWDFMLDADKGIGYIRITAFSRDTASELKKALEELKTKDIKGLVLDLRFNPGGLLTSAIEISDYFLEKGRIVSTTGRNVPERSWDAVEPGTFDGFPMAVLINRYSASASEIVSAALQDHDRAVVIGERSWGKGSVQNVIQLPDQKSALKLTTASYQRPSGKNIHRFPDAKESDEWGVRPDDGYLIRLNDQEMTELVVDRKRRDIVGAKVDEANEDGQSDDTAAKAEEDSAEGEQDGGDKPVAKAKDRQLQKAVEYLSTELARAD